jgi:Myb-like DNA-binding domain
MQHSARLDGCLYVDLRLTEQMALGRRTLHCHLKLLATRNLTPRQLPLSFDVIQHLNPTVKRGGWTSEEDALILDRVARGFKWAEIAKELQNRIGESVRARYANWLDPTLKKTEWTEEEDEVLFYQQAKLGNRWARIRRYLPGRSENSIKNRYHNQKNTYKRKQERQVLVKAQLTEIGNTVTMSDAASSSKCGSWVSKAQHGRQKRQKVVLGGLTTNV